MCFNYFLHLPHCHGGEVSQHQAEIKPDPSKGAISSSWALPNLCVILKQLIFHLLMSVLVSTDLRSLWSQSRLHPWLPLYWFGFPWCPWKMELVCQDLYFMRSHIITLEICFPRAFRPMPCFFNIFSSIEVHLWGSSSTLKSCRNESSVCDGFDRISS